jgi:translation initiation factor 3 subunit C
VSQKSESTVGTTGDLRNPKVLNTIPSSQSLVHTIMSRFFRQAADSDSESSDSEESLLSSDEDAAPAKSAAPAKPAMSRFLRTADASDSSSSSESESEDEDESNDEAGAHKEAKPKSRFLRDSDEEESDEEVKRVVKSARDKRLEEMEATGRAMDNALKINDWIAISSGM